MTKSDDLAAEDDKTNRMAGAGAGVIANAQIGTAYNNYQ